MPRIERRAELIEDTTKPGEEGGDAGFRETVLLATPAARGFTATTHRK